MSASPAFQFYPGDFLTGTCMMSAAEVGAYIRLLCYQWHAGGVPDDDAKLARLALCDASDLPSVRAKFERGPDGLLRNARLESVRDRQREFAEHQSERAKRGWKTRHKMPGESAGIQRAFNGHSTGIIPAMPNGCRNDARTMPDSCSPSPSSSSSLGSASPTILPPAKPDGDKGAAEQTQTKEPDAPKKRARDPLFDALASATGCNPEQLTKTEARAVGVALAEIKTASPDLTPDEIKRRAKNYQVHMPNATLTANALKAHWARCSVSHGPNNPPARIGQNLQPDRPLPRYAPLPGYGLEDPATDYSDEAARAANEAFKE